VRILGPFGLRRYSQLRKPLEGRFGVTYCMMDGVPGRGNFCREKLLWEKLCPKFQDSIFPAFLRIGTEFFPAEFFPDRIFPGQSPPGMLNDCPALLISKSQWFDCI
jgi:hypothetical protein